ncbi:MAG: helix-turn-helix domain-containing protein [Flammeovirgaceae bacterium]
MPLFRCDFYRLVFIRSKGVEWLLPEKQFESTENCIYFSYPGKLESWKSNENIKGYLICFTEDFFQTNRLLTTEYPFFTFEKSKLLYLEDNEAAYLAQQQEEMLEEITNNYLDTKEMLTALLQRYLISIKRLFTKSDGEIPENKRNDFLIYQKFREELDEYFAALASDKLDKHPNVSTIAERIFLNPSYLNTVVKSVSGKTASIMIQEKTILEAKSYLMHTDLQITEIAFQLGFDNVSYFTRLFKKWTATSPSAFKKSHLP